MTVATILFVLVAFFNNESGNGQDKNSWFVDSGASSHMTNRKGMLQNIRMIKKKEILIANNEKLEGNLIGDIKLNSTLKGKEISSIIQNVLYVPNLCANLLSVIQLNKQGYRVLFDMGKCHILDRDGELMAKAKLIDNMSQLSTK